MIVLIASQGSPQDKAVTEPAEQYAALENNAGRRRVESIVLCDTEVGVPSAVVPEPKLMPNRGVGAAIASVAAVSRKKRGVAGEGMVGCAQLSKARNERS